MVLAHMKFRFIIIDTFVSLNTTCEMIEDEKYLFERISKGDEAAFKVIYNRYVPRLYYFVYEYIPQVRSLGNY